MQSSDTLLLQRWASSRDAEAFREIVLRHGAMVYGTCRRILGNAADVEDVAQECFLRLAETPGTVRSSLAGWLYSAARSRSMDRVRRRRIETVGTSKISDIDVPNVDAEWRELEAMVDECIAQLPEHLQVPLIRHYLGGESQTAIAESLGVSRPAISQRLDRALRLVREDLHARGIARSAGVAALLARESNATVPAELLATCGKAAVAGGASMQTIGATAFVTVVMFKKLAVGVCAALVIAGAAWFGIQWASQPGGGGGPILADDTHRGEDEGALGARASDKLDGSEGSDRSVGSAGGMKARRNNNSGLGDRPRVTRTDATTADGLPEPIRSWQVPDNNGMHFFLLASELFAEEDMKAYQSLRDQGALDPDNSQLRELLAKLRPAFDAIRRGVEVGNAMMPRAEHGYRENMEYVNRWRQLAELMSLDAEYSASVGNDPFALATYEAVLSFAHDSANGGAIITGLVGYLAERNVAEDLREGMANGTYTEASLDGVRRLMGDAHAIGYRAGELFELEMFGMMDWVHTTPEGVADFRSILLDPATGLSEQDRYTISQMPEPVFAEHVTGYLSDYEVFIRQANLPYYEASQTNVEELYGDNPLSRMLIPNIEHLYSAQARRDAEVLGTLVMAAVEEHLQEHGSYPGSLEELSAASGLELPNDPFTGAPFFYSPQGGGYLLYSAGYDGTDSGGEPVAGQQSGPGDVVIRGR